MNDPVKPRRDPRRLEQQHELRLPELTGERIPGTRLVRRAGVAILATAGVAIGILIAVVVVAHIEVTVPASGVLQPEHVWPVRSVVAGTIAEVLVASGDTVHPGQILVRLDTLAAAAAIAQLEAELGAQRLTETRLVKSGPVKQRQHEAALAGAQAQAARARAALRQRIGDFGLKIDVDSVLRAVGHGQHAAIDIAAAEVAAADAGVDAARATLDDAALAPLDVDLQRWTERRLRARLAELRTEQRRSAIEASAQGIVLTDDLERLRNAAVQPGEAVLEIASRTGWQAILVVRESDIHRIRVHDRVLLDVPALETSIDEPLRATVVTVSADPISVVEPRGNTAALVREAPSSTGRYRVVVALDQSQLDSLHLAALRRGYAVQGKIVTRSVRAIVLLQERLRERFRGTSQ